MWTALVYFHDVLADGSDLHGCREVEQPYCRRSAG
jgi:hypothetical protein